MRTQRYPVALISMAILMLLPAAGARSSAFAPANERLVEPAALQKLLPAPEGWTRADVRANQVSLASDCAYTYASAWYTKDTVRVKLTLADTDGHADNLMALAAMIVTLPENHFDQVDSATLKRMKVEGNQAVELWDAAKKQGEMTVVVSGRFVASVETSNAESVETIRAIFNAVDLKALAALR